MIVLSLLVVSCWLPQTNSERVSAIRAALPRAAPESQGGVLRLFEAGQLTGHARLEALVGELRSVERGASSDPMEPAGILERLTGRRREVDVTTEGLVGAIRDRIEPRLAQGQCVEHVAGGTLALLGDARQQAWLAGFLAGAAEFHGLVDLQARIYIGRKGAFPESSAARSGQVLSQGALAILLMELESVQADVIVAPRVLAFPFQEAELTAVEELPYLQDYELQVLPDSDTEIADPVIGVAESGIRLRLRAVPLAGGRLAVYTNLEYSAVAQPIPSTQIRIGRHAQEVTVQLPDITRVHLEGHFDVSSGQTLVLVSGDPSGKQEVLVLLETKRVDAVDER